MWNSPFGWRDQISAATTIESSCVGQGTFLKHLLQLLRHWKRQASFKWNNSSLLVLPGATTGNVWTLGLICPTRPLHLPYEAIPDEPRPYDVRKWCGSLLKAGFVGTAHQQIICSSLFLCFLRFDFKPLRQSKMSCLMPLRGWLNPVPGAAVKTINPPLACVITLPNLNTFLSRNCAMRKMNFLQQCHVLGSPSGPCPLLSTTVWFYYTGLFKIDIALQFPNPVR